MVCMSHSCVHNQIDQQRCDRTALDSLIFLILTLLLAATSLKLVISPSFHNLYESTYFISTAIDQFLTHSLDKICRFVQFSLSCIYSSRKLGKTNVERLFSNALSIDGMRFVGILMILISQLSHLVMTFELSKPKFSSFA